MQAHWLRKKEKQSSRCILFMAGWGMGPEPFSFLAADDCDVFICYDYRELTPLDMELFSGYSSLELLAWSMGVWVAARLFADKDVRFSQATALAGTLQPIDDKKGIPVAAFDETLADLDESKLETFYVSMFAEQGQAMQFLARRPRRSVSSVRDELVSLRENVQHSGEVQDIFTRKIVTMRDRIFPARNQVRAWGKQNSQQMKWSHFPFYQQVFWQEFFSKK